MDSLITTVLLDYSILIDFLKIDLKTLAIENHITELYI